MAAYRTPAPAPPSAPPAPAWPNTPNSCPACGAEKDARFDEGHGHYRGPELGEACSGGLLARWFRGCQRGPHLHVRCSRCGWKWVVWP